VFRIRRILDDALEFDRRELEQVKVILRARFPDAPPAHADDLEDRLRDPMQHRFRTLLLVADDLRGNVRGFALASHEPTERFVYLDYLASDKRITGSGIGGALYEALRGQARALDAVGLFFECAPDDPGEVDSLEVLRANAARMRFYERFGALPIDGTDYRTPVREGDRGYPYLMFDPADLDAPLRRRAARRIVRAILERKYADLCPPAYVKRVVRSFRDDPVRLRASRYTQPGPPRRRSPGRRAAAAIALVVNDRHDIHHVRERGYVEAPIRISAILRGLEASGMFARMEPKSFGIKPILAVHDAALVQYLERACAETPEGRSVYPYVFPIRNPARPPADLSVRAGYFCIDTFTPIHRNAYPAARRAVDCALTAADTLLRGTRLAYALVRPPGHHAERRVFGGFCYFNSGAAAAHHLSQHGRVAMLDLDYHHGNGQQDIFYARADVLTISIHGTPRVAYPYFSGFSDEVGEGEGRGFNVNLPQPERLDGEGYRRALDRAIERIRAFAPAFVVVALGLDPAKGDPTGTWSLGPRDFEQNGRRVAALRLPTLVVQEGGYRTRTLGKNVLAFFEGLWQGTFAAPTGAPPQPAPAARPERRRR
jgi:acetoin utilization deacetylase AcuC-like enzyme/GNAT superfamily N-acetyltransferase